MKSHSYARWALLPGTACLFSSCITTESFVSTMGAAAEGLSGSGYASGSSYGSGYRSSSDSGNSSQSSSERTGYAQSGHDDAAGAEEESDSGDSGVKAFEDAQMARVEAYRKMVNGGGAVSGGSGSAGSGGGHEQTARATGDNQWTFVGEFDGLRVSWKYRRELKDQYESALRFENTNSYTVTVDYEPWFITADGEEYTEGGMRFSLGAGQIKSGNSGGAFFYVRDGNGDAAQPPRAGGVKNLTVSRQ